MKLGRLGILGFSGLLPLPLGTGVEGGSRSSGGMGQPGPQLPHFPWPPTWCPEIQDSIQETLHIYIFGQLRHICWHDGSKQGNGFTNS